MLIKKGNPDKLTCWRSLDGVGNAFPCMAEHCVAYQPHLNIERKTVTETERNELMATSTEWVQIATHMHKPINQPRIVIEREVENGEGSCNALPVCTPLEA